MSLYDAAGHLLGKAEAESRQGETEGWDRLSRKQKTALMYCLASHKVRFFPQFQWTHGGTGLHPGWACQCGKYWVPDTDGWHFDGEKQFSPRWGPLD